MLMHDLNKTVTKQNFYIVQFKMLSATLVQQIVQTILLRTLYQHY